MEILKPDQFMFTKHEIAEGLNVAISLEQAGPLLQSWLWFGTITKSFGLRLNTASIHRYLWYWLAAESRAHEEERIRHYQIVNDCLETVHRVLPMQTDIGDRHRGGRAVEDVSMIDSFLVDDDDDDDNTLLAISALAEMLDLTQEEINAGIGGTRSHNWIETLNVRAWLLQAGWCINEVATVINRLEGSYVNLLVYLARMDRSPLSRHHDRCRIAECVYSKIDYTTYRPAHVLDGCLCSLVTFAYPDAKFVDTLLHRGTLPIVTYSTSGRSPNRLLVRRPESSDDSNCISYVAISHVWSDRLGNLRENALSSCQLQRIQAQVNSLSPSRNGDVPFWIDTLCVPRELTTRGLAIRSMRKVYSEAEKVLVLDSTL
ncbi:uncharacterized protein A1O5_03899 [Cladophialophora psammophila CBS 110553]|uniref:Heterokaryon incompatibility domain-containing protein n=1 Tax=Cladophialophora psammophila CBS 110553 TaxID=1182543 RepID=W9WX20_9EURO|nr:uncharacterized protein A1O5_03899 [Cladophialophora psammophila CBS 110553]EXJ72752.1 hypothetical protein A1O5_03899 [Cladophialophora psammophila CBS 110553]